MVANRNVLKAYAPQARKDFIQAMTNRAALFGITKAGAAVGEERGELFILDGMAFPKSVAEQRKRLIDRIAATSFDQTLEAVAYTWFNRFLAIRYMELHGYLDHGYRVLSHPAGDAEPEILQQAQHLTLPGLDPDMVIDLKLRGDQDEALYRNILIAQCNDLHRAMPFLFERINDETELLLPENLLQSDSIVRKLVSQIAESEWNEIEIIGWLYQFYISEKKDQVMGNVVKSEDIPAATQLFTPNWIVKYMVQNSLGAQWLATYPDSPLKATMAYYIEPANQAPEAQAQLDAITPKTLDPESLTLIDPAVGSGHILVEAYDLFRAIYIELGYTPGTAARLILTKNLYGLDIDDRAAQMAGFALMMRARADDRTLLLNPPALNVVSLTDSDGWDADAIAEALEPGGPGYSPPPSILLPETLSQKCANAEQQTGRIAIARIIALFNGAKTYGSLITVPEAVMTSLPILQALVAKPLSDDLMQRKAQVEARERLADLLTQAKILGNTYNCTVANPPYMGSNAMNKRLKDYVGKHYKAGKADILCCFMERSIKLTSVNGSWSMINFPSWMFLGSFEKLRLTLLEKCSFSSLLHLGRGIFGSDFGTTSFVVSNRAPIAKEKAKYKRLFDKTSEVQSVETLSDRFLHKQYGLSIISQTEFSVIPGSPIAYWLSQEIRAVFQSGRPLSDIAVPRQGFATGSNDQFLRIWHEVSIRNIGFNHPNATSANESAMKWFPCNKGGQFRRWYGNRDIVADWQYSGKSMKAFPGSVIRNPNYYFLEGMTWSTVSISKLSMRYSPPGSVFETKGSVCFPIAGTDIRYPLAVMNTNVVEKILLALSPTLDFHEGPIGKVPILSNTDESILEATDLAIAISKVDWDSFERSWDFEKLRIIDIHGDDLQASYTRCLAEWEKSTLELRAIETNNNQKIILTYGLSDEISPDVSLSEITLTCNPHYRYGGDRTDAELEVRLLSDTMRELVSYGVGLMMGRYSLVEPGLIYAHAGNEGFDPSRYGAFPADDDGIVPITEEPWFADDAAARLEQFLAIAWPKAPIGGTLATLTDGLTHGKGGEPRAALRAYLAKTFYKDHLQTYRNRPIYWLFSSGRQKAFECLVYLHRYNESTLARMRTAYVTPLMGKMQQRIADLEAEIAGSASSAEKTRKGRDRDKIVKQLAELRGFDEELRHLADQRIALDLDDGVKVNYGRFGNLLAAKDKVCGKDND